MSGLIPCHGCGTPVAVGARCQQCGTTGSFAFTNQPEPTGQRNLRIVFGVLGGLLIVLLLVSLA